MQSGRTLVLDRLAARIAGLSLRRPIRVAVDGRTASGKTILADELAGCLRRRGRDAIRASIDGFHRPKAERYARGRHSAQGYYDAAFDLSAVMALLLDPLGPGGHRATPCCWAGRTPRRGFTPSGTVRLAISMNARARRH